MIGLVPAVAFANGGADEPRGAPGIQVGGIVSMAPRYEGATNYRVIGFPFVAPTGFGMIESGTVQFRGVDDLRFRLWRSGAFEAGPLIGWRFGRDEEDGSRLRGLGDVEGGFVAGGYAAYRIGMFKPFLSYHHQLTGDSTGGILRFGSEALIKLDRGISVTATVGGTYASSDYMDHYFGITSAQAAGSTAGLAVFDAGADIKDAYIGLSGTVPLSELWSLRVGAKYTRLIGDAADSPVVETADQFSGSVGLSYRFGWGK